MSASSLPGYHADGAIVPERRGAGTPALLGLLVCADLAFVVLHVAHISVHSGNLLFRLDTEHGHPELFQYTKFFWIVILLGWIWRRSVQPVYAGWMLLFSYLLCDDALQIHERAGRFLAQHSTIAASLGARAADFGEVIASGTVGVFLIAMVGLLHRRSDHAARKSSLMLLVLLAFLGAFGVGIDLLHAFAGNGYAAMLLTVIEDGGEMLAVSATCWYVFRVAAGVRGVG